jgi:hypothetical protein
MASTAVSLTITTTNRSHDLCAELSLGAALSLGSRTAVLSAVLGLLAVFIAIALSFTVVTRSLAININSSGKSLASGTIGLSVTTTNWVENLSAHNASILGTHSLGSTTGVLVAEVIISWALFIISADHLGRLRW